jgi:hypothetical protein
MKSRLRWVEHAALRRIRNAYTILIGKTTRKEPLAGPR